jgi:hypothetical protein
MSAFYPVDRGLIDDAADIGNFKGGEDFYFFSIPGHLFPS